MINIATCCWNAGEYIGKCIDSVLMQNYTNYRMFIIDDVSNDNTVDIAKKHIKSDQRFTIIQNNDKKYKLKNFDDLISNKTLINDDDIIIELDGDDWLATDNALSIVGSIYDNSNILISNSRFIYCRGYPGFSSDVDIKNIRQNPFTFSHIRSWRASLWRSVNKKYFIDPRTNSYFKITADMAYSLPMLEIAGQNRYKHIKDTLLVYNDISDYNDHKPGSGSGGRIEQITTEQIVRALKYVN